MKVYATLVTAVIILVSYSAIAHSETGVVNIKADQLASTIYVNGKKAAMTGDDGAFTSITLPEGDYLIKVEKVESEWVYGEIRSIFVGPNTSVNFEFKLKQFPSKKRFTRLEKLATGMINLESTETIPKTNNRYINHKNGTITDKVTNLMWTRCVVGKSGTNCQDGDATRMFVNSSECSADNESRFGDDYDSYESCSGSNIADSVISQTNEAGFAGFRDWRLPTIDELHSLVVCPTGRKSVKRGIPTIDEYYTLVNASKNGILDRSIIKDHKNSRYMILNAKEIDLRDGMCLEKPDDLAINEEMFPNSPYDAMSSSEKATSDKRYWRVYFSTGADRSGGLVLKQAPVRMVRSIE